MSSRADVVRFWNDLLAPRSPAQVGGSLGEHAGAGPGSAKAYPLDGGVRAVSDRA